MPSAPPSRSLSTPRQRLSRAARREIRRAAALAHELHMHAFRVHADGSITWTLCHEMVSTTKAQAKVVEARDSRESKRATRSRTRAAAHAELTERARAFRVRSVIQRWLRASSSPSQAMTLPPPPPTQPLPMPQPPVWPLPTSPPLLLPPGERMDDERAQKRAASPPMAMPLAEPHAKRVVLSPRPPPGLPPPSLPPSPPTSPTPSQPSSSPPSSSPPPSRLAQRDGTHGDRGSERTPAKAPGVDHSGPKPDPETVKSRRTQAHTSAADASARAARETTMHAARVAVGECSMCTRRFPWLHNTVDARCHTCDVIDQHVRRIVFEQLGGETASKSQPSSSPMPSPDPRGYKCGGCDNLIHSGDVCEVCRPPRFLAWPGARVRLHSLSRADLNGKWGTILDFNYEKGRWAVNVDGPGGGRRILLKGENLEHAPESREGPSFAWDYPSDYDSDDACQFRRPWESDSD